MFLGDVLFNKSLALDFFLLSAEYTNTNFKRLNWLISKIFQPIQLQNVYGIKLLQATQNV